MFSLNRLIYFHLKSDPASHPSHDVRDLGRLADIPDSELRDFRRWLSHATLPEGQNTRVNIKSTRERTDDCLTEKQAPSLAVRECFGEATPESIANREHSIVIGISMNNPFFNAENTRDYLAWALQHTKDNVLVVLADGPHAINLEAFQGYDTEEARVKALEMGRRKAAELEGIIAGLPAEDANRVRVKNWKSISRDSDYQFNYTSLEQQFLCDPGFHDHLEMIVRELCGHIPSLDVKSLTPEQLDRASLYVLHELAAFLRGFSDGNQLYDLVIYPKTSNLWGLISHLQTEKGQRDIWGGVRHNGPTGLAVVQSEDDV